MVNTKVNSKDHVNRLTDIDPRDIFDLADPRNRQTGARGRKEQHPGA